MADFHGNLMDSVHENQSKHTINGRTLPGSAGGTGCGIMDLRDLRRRGVFAARRPSADDLVKNLAGIKMRPRDPARFRGLESDPAPVYECATIDSPTGRKPQAVRSLRRWLPISFVAAINQPAPRCLGGCTKPAATHPIARPAPQGTKNPKMGGNAIRTYDHGPGAGVG